MTDTTTNTETTAQHADQHSDPTDAEVREKLALEQRYQWKKIAITTWLSIGVAGLAVSTVAAIFSANGSHAVATGYQYIWLAVAGLALSRGYANSSRGVCHRWWGYFYRAPDETLDELKRKLVYGNDGGDEQ